MVVQSGKTLLACCLMVFGLGFSARAQDTVVHVVQDLESWTSARFRYKVSKKLDLRLSQNLRLGHNSSQIDQHFTELTGNYRVIKPLTLAIEGRYGFKSKESETEKFFRMFYSLNASRKIGRWAFGGRLAFQSRNELSGSDIDDDPTRNFRYRAELGYNIKNWKLDPEVSFELFRRTGVEEPEFHKYRFKISTGYSLKKAGKLRFFYAFEEELKDNYPKATSILGVNYTFTAKKKASKD